MDFEEALGRFVQTDPAELPEKAQAPPRTERKRSAPENRHSETETFAVAESVMAGASGHHGAALGSALTPDRGQRTPA